MEREEDYARIEQAFQGRTDAREEVQQLRTTLKQERELRAAAERRVDEARE